MSDEVAIAILAGGASTRMGRDKALLKYRGVSMLDRVIRLARRHSTSVAVVGRRGEDRDGVVWIPDEHPNGGPVQAIATAIKALGADTLVVACDMPLLSDEHVSWLLAAWSNDTSRLGLITTSSFGFQPLCSMYTERLLPALELAMQTGVRSLREVIERNDVPTIEMPATLEGGMVNVNTLEDYNALADIDDLLT